MKHESSSRKRFTKAQIEAAIAAAPERIESWKGPYDPNDPKAIDAFWKNSIKSRSPEELREKLAERGRKRGERGPQKAPTKASVTVRLDRDILARLKASGEGWQTRLNSLLRAAMDALK